MSDLLTAIEANDGKRVLRLVNAGQPRELVRDAVVSCIVHERNDMLALLLDSGVDPNLRLPGQQWTLLHLAAEHLNVPALRLLLDHGADVHLVDASGSTPLHQLVDAEADALNQVGVAPEPTATRLLLEAGADPHTRDSRGETPMGIARGYGYMAALAEMDAWRAR